MREIDRSKSNAQIARVERSFSLTPTFSARLTTSSSFVPVLFVTMFHRLSPVVLLAFFLASPSVASSIRGVDDTELTDKNQFTCTVSAFDEDSCKTTSDDDGGACVWCSYQSYGVCVSSDQSEQIEETIPQVTCEDANSAVEEAPLVTEELAIEEAVTDPYDTSCLLAGMNSDDAESVCAATKDEDGDACTWCDIGGVYGLCLNPDQVDAVGQFLTCNKSHTSADLHAEQY